MKLKHLYYLLLALILLAACERTVDTDKPGNPDDGDKASFESFFNTDEELKLHEFEVHITQTEWNRLLSILKQNMKSDQYVRADFIYRSAPGGEDEEFFEEVGFRIRGNTTRRLPYADGEFQRAHFKIKFDKRFDQIEGTDEYEVRRTRDFADVEALNLKWGREGDEADVSQIREIYQYDMMRKAGVFVPRTTSVRLILVVGGERVDYGMYTAIEPIDDEFLEKRFDGDEGDLYKCLWKGMGPATLSRTSASGSRTGIGDPETGYEPSYDLKHGELANGRLVDFTQQLGNLGTSELKSYLDNNFDVDRFLRYLAMNVILGMPDDYWGMGNNYYLYFPDEGKITFIPYDYDHGLGGGWAPRDLANADIFDWWDGTGNDYRALMKVWNYADYRSTYEDYLKEFALESGAVFNYSDYKNNYFDKLKTMYSPYLINDTGEGQDFEHYSESTYFSRKISSLSGQLD